MIFIISYIYNIYNYIVLSVYLHVPDCDTYDTAQLNIGYVVLIRLTPMKVTPKDLTSPMLSGT